MFDSNFTPACWNVSVAPLNSYFLLKPFESLGTQWKKHEFGNQTGLGNYSAFIPVFNNSIYVPFNDWLISPPYDLGTGNNKSLEFDMALTKNGTTSQAYLEADDTFAVVISSDSCTSWKSTNTLRTWNSTSFIPNTGAHVVIPLTNYNGIVRIGFYARSTVTNIIPIPNLFVDNVKVSVALSVALTEFTGRKQDSYNLLAWRTATEQNNKGFELQRSALPNAAGGGFEFTSIGFVPTKAAGGSSNAPLTYLFADKHPPSGGTCYRLKQVDIDGKATLSDIVYIKADKGSHLEITALYPNPAIQHVYVTLYAPAVQEVQLLVTDMAGRIVQQQTTLLQQGDNNKVINVAALHSGTYLVKVICANGCRPAVYKFVKE